MAADRGLVGTTIGRYRIVAELGRGGMAVVYRGEDTELGRAVAVKVMHARLEAAAEALARFRREARAVAALKHPNVIEIFDYAPAEEGRPGYIVTELCQGPSLQQYVTDHGTPLPEVAAMMGARVARALACAHERGIIHRDVKLENVLLDHGGRLVLTDFGIARVAGSETLTDTGALVGSPAYMSPEQARGDELDVRSDVFSCGTLLYRLTTGALPFAGKDPVSTALAIIKGDYRPPGARNPRIAASLERVIRRCLKADRAERYGSAAELCAALEAVCAEDGLTDLDAELARYFADPAAYNEALGPRVVAGCLGRARAAVAARQWARAGAECNRVLALDPDHAEARALVARLGRGERGRRALALAGGALAVCGLAAGGALLWPRLMGPPARGQRDAAPAVVAPRPAAAPAPPVLVADAAAARAAADAPARPPVLVAARADRPKPLTPSPGPVDAAAPRSAVARDGGAPRPAAVVPVPVTFALSPWCNLSVDGKPSGRVPPPKELLLAPGPHRVVCSQKPDGPLHYERTHEIKAGAPVEIRARITGEATLRVALGEGDEIVIAGSRVANRATARVRPGTHTVTVLKGGVELRTGVVDIVGSCTLVDVPRPRCAP
jgi:serine/threonine-protein kinase